MVDCMDIAVLIIEALKFIFPAYCANAAPVLAGGGRQMDFGRNFFDGKPIFGKNKTFRGFFFGLAIGVFVGLVEGMVFGTAQLQCIVQCAHAVGCALRRSGWRLLEETVGHCSWRFAACY